MWNSSCPRCRRCVLVTTFHTTRIQRRAVGLNFTMDVPIPPDPPLPDPGPSSAPAPSATRSHDVDAERVPESEMPDPVDLSELLGRSARKAYEELQGMAETWVPPTARGCGD